MWKKFASPGESLPQTWPVDGTVGYDFLRAVNGVFIQRRNERSFTNVYRRFAGEFPNVDAMAHESKKLILLSALSSELNGVDAHAGGASGC